MQPDPVPLLLALALAGCAARGDRAPVCDGLHRRPANPPGLALAQDEPTPTKAGDATAASYVPCGVRP